MFITFQDRSETQHFGLLLGVGAAAFMLCDRNYAPQPNPKLSSNFWMNTLSNGELNVGFRFCYRQIYSYAIFF